MRAVEKHMDGCKSANRSGRRIDEPALRIDAASVSVAQAVQMLLQTAGIGE